MFELLFLFAFTLHNIEEGLWLPGWSKYAGKYHPQVSKREFHFALIVITSLGYLLTFMFFLTDRNDEIIRYIYLGFVLMMCFNSIFPHLLATIVLRRYSPGTLTGLLLNLPIGAVLVIRNIEAGGELYKLLTAAVIITILTLAALRPLFKLGAKLLDEY